MFWFFDLFARDLAAVAKPRDQYEARREASMGARRVQERREARMRMARGIKS